MEPAMPDRSSTVAAHQATIEARDLKEWKWQFGLRGALLILLIIDIGLVGACVSAANSHLNGVYASFWLGHSATWLLIPVVVSLVWTLVYLPLSYFRKARLHPGFAVGIDLILWMVLVVMGALFLFSGALSSIYSGRDLGISYASYDYYHTPGEQGRPARNSSYSVIDGEAYTYLSYDGNSVVRQPGSVDYDCPHYNSCAEQQRILGIIRSAISTFVAASAFATLCGLLHFVLWVWACVACARWNRRRSSKDDYMRARLIADGMVKDMRDRGEALPMEQRHPASAASPMYTTENVVYR